MTAQPRPAYNSLTMQTEQIQTPRLKRFARFAWFVVAYNLLVIMWGAYVRASGSGAGCGEHWPLCNGEIVPRAHSVELLVELSHRITTSLSGLLSITLVVVAFRVLPRRHPARLGAVLTLAFVVLEGLVGAAQVKLGLTAHNDSLARALVGSVHLVNTFLLLAAMGLTAWWASGAPRLRLRGQGIMPHLFALGLLGTLALAASGAVVALGDTLFPARTLIEGLRQDLSPTAHFLLRLRFIHPSLALVVGAYVLLTASYVSNFLRPTARVKRLCATLITLVLLQLCVGLLNVYLLAPIWLQLLHLLLADLLWLALVLTAAAALAQTDTQATQVEAINLRPAAEV